MRICTNCVMDESDPDISFTDGVCNHCIEYRQKERVRRAEAGNLQWMYDQIRQDGQKQKYDCLLGLSGGVDSSLCLHYLVENGLRPLCFSIDNGWNDPLADENIMRLVEGLKVPFYRYVIDIAKFKDLQKAFIQSGTANIEIPTDHVLMASTYEMARKYNIKWIISGGNLATEGIMPKAWGYQARDLTFIKSVYRKAFSKELTGLPLISLKRYLLNRFFHKIRIMNLLDYYDYDRGAAIKLLNEKYGYKDYGDKHSESRFTKWFQNFYLPMFFGIDKRKAHLSSMINSKQITREQALEELQKPLEYQRIINMQGTFVRHSYKDYKNSEFWWNLFSGIYGYFK